MFKFLKHITLKTKILALSIVLIILPAAMICYMGLKSIREKTANQRIIYIGTANLIRDILQSQLYQQENILHNSIIELLTRSESDKNLKHLLQTMEIENIAFKNFFLVSDEGTLISGMINFDDSKHDVDFQEPDPAARNHFASAEYAEFVEKDPGLAISIYREALNTSKTSYSKALVFSRLGRCYMKMQAYENAIHSYQKILELRDPEIAIGKIPAAVVAFTQIASCYRAENANRECFMTFVQAYKYVLESPWNPADGEYIYYLNLISKQIKDLQASLGDEYPEINTLKNELAEWKNREKKIREIIEVLYHASKYMSRNFSPDENHWISSEVEHLAQRLGPDTVFKLSYFNIPKSMVPLDISIAGFQINHEYVLKNLFPEILSSIELGKDVIAGILDQKDSLLYPITDSPISGYLSIRAFDKYIPEWRVALFDRSGKSLEQLANREKALYFSSFLGVLTIMLIGISVLARAVIHETEVSRLKSEFVSNVTHELKTPLTLIRMFGETLNSGIVEDEARQKEYFSIISKESERLTHLINNVLDFSNIDKGKKDYSFERTDLVALVRYSLEAYKFHIRNMGFEIENELPSEPIYLVIDKDAISQALLNLLSNSVKYSADLKYIRVEVRSKSDSVWISVIDRGVGIPKEEQKRIFDKFYRIPGKNGSGSKGSGLGLTLTKYIVNAHGGTIQVESVPGKGSQFTIILPR